MDCRVGLVWFVCFCLFDFHPCKDNCIACCLLANKHVYSWWAHRQHLNVYWWSSSHFRTTHVQPVHTINTFPTQAIKTFSRGLKVKVRSPQGQFAETPSTLLPAVSVKLLLVHGGKRGEPSVETDSHLQPPSSEVPCHYNTMMLQIQCRNKCVRARSHQK